MKFILIGIIALGIVITILFIKFKSKAPSLVPTKREEKVILKKLKKMEKADLKLEEKHKSIIEDAQKLRGDARNNHDKRVDDLSDLVQKR